MSVTQIKNHGGSVRQARVVYQGRRRSGLPFWWECLCLALLVLTGAGCLFHNNTPSSSVAVTVSNSGQPLDFQTRCAQPGVVRCLGFDSDTEVPVTPGYNGWPHNVGITPGDKTTAVLDTTIKASGNSSVKFTIPGLSGANSAGNVYVNFSPDLLTQFAENDTFYVQWRQLFSPEFLNTAAMLDTGGGEAGWKQIDISLGDIPGRSARSCDWIEIVFGNWGGRHIVSGYNSCYGSDHHGGFDGFYVIIPGTSDFNLQSGRPNPPRCLYSQNTDAARFPPNGSCFPYYPNEWMTFKAKVQIGPRTTTGNKNEWYPSFITLWMGREGQPLQKVIEHGPYYLTAGPPNDSDWNGQNHKYGKIWLLPYHTNKDATRDHPTAYTWYDELIISRNDIADPNR